MLSEKTIFLSPIQLQRIEKSPKQIKAAYIGSYCCEHLLPSVDDVKKIISMGMRPIISAPILTDRFLDRLCRVVQDVLSFVVKPEVSINDIGSLVKLRRLFGNSVDISAGRHLFAYMAKDSIAYNEHFTKEFNISFLETDNAHNADSLLRSGKFKIAFHYPFRIYALTRICPYCKTIPNECSRQCVDRCIPLNGGEIIWRGNAYFTRENVMPKLLPHRLVLSYDVGH